MGNKINAVVVGYSTFSWELVDQLKDQIGGRLYYVLPDWDQAMEASLEAGVIAVRGEITDTDVLDQLTLETWDIFVAGSRQDEANVLSALYAKNKGARAVYARVFESKLIPLLESIGITAVQTSHTAAAFMAINILKPAVADLVSLTRGEFDLEEMDVADFPELLGCRLGNLQGEQLHIIAVAKEGNIFLSYNTLVEPGSKLILIYNNQIKRRLRQEVHRVAVQAAQRLRESRAGL
jgi:Trk K+ transport system NAD-binding subunit